MEVVTAPPNGTGIPPFYDRDVREWSRIDNLTGVLERARLETDHWTAHTNNSSHKYNKVVDCRARASADSGLQQKARRQLEVYQSQVPGGHLQVIKTHTVSTNRWRNNIDGVSKDFENLQLTGNPLDLSSQKSKANIGKTASRRPPTRARLQDDSSNNLQGSVRGTAAINLSRVSRLCHQIHDKTVEHTFGKQQNGQRNNNDTTDEIINERRNSLTRTKSTSSEDIFLSLTTDKDTSIKSSEDLGDLEQLQSWRRTSKLRRSLQYPKQTNHMKKPLDLPELNGNVKKIREDLEKDRRLSTAFRGNNVNLEALDQILQSVSSSSSVNSDKSLSLEANPDETPKNLKKESRNSFVTVQTLQEVKGRLRKTNSFNNKNKGKEEDEEIDDGIVTEDVKPKPGAKSYIYGMETTMKKPFLGTGSLESRSKLLNGNANLRNEDWYNRRKSYGFEQVHQNENYLDNKLKIESSTDSGICRSTEIPYSSKQDSFNSVKQISSIFERPIKSTGITNGLKSTTITIPIKANFGDDLSWNEINAEKQTKRHSIAVDESSYVTYNKFRRAVNDKELDDVISQNRKSKKVEFCKTEVHFAAESGKVNIVETDEKPPPTNNFRRRRRSSGPFNDDLKKSDLPVLHFGDSFYEKTLLGVSDDNQDNDQNCLINSGNVTVSTKFNYIDVYEDDKKENSDNSDNIKGILKNKPLKPTPYLLGDNESHLSTVSENESKWGAQFKSLDIEPSFWKSTVTLHNAIFNPNGNSTDVNEPEFRKLLKNHQPTSMKLDLINHKKAEASSEVHFVTNSDNQRQVSVAEDHKDLNNSSHWSENKIYSTKINFGNDGATVVSNNFKDKPMFWPSNKEDKSKDLNHKLSKGLIVRIGKEDDSEHVLGCKRNTQQDNTTTTKITIDLSSTSNKYFHKHQRSHSFKSTSLILDTIKNESNIKNSSKNQLEVLKKLYEDVQSDSDVDADLQNLMTNVKSNIFEDDNSVVSGSWSKMRAQKAIKEQINKTSLKLNAKVDKGKCENLRQTKYLEPNKGVSNITNQEAHCYSPTLSKSISLNEPSLKHSYVTHQLNSPSLVGKSTTNILETNNKKTQLRSLTETKLQQKFINTDMVLRQPKKSEMTYFGVKISPKLVKKETVIMKEKPDLLQHTRYTKRNDINTPIDPIYENINKKSKSKFTEFDNTILDELTKAADEILQAVSSFTDDDQNQCVDKPKLETILETKSWSSKQLGNSVDMPKKQPLKATSSNSSIESLKIERKKDNNIEKGSISHKNPERLTQKKVNSELISSKALTKARRLQRANSREALFRNHGSSSEDLGVIETPIRKPRQIKKTKITQLTMTNAIEMKKKHRTTSSKNKEVIEKVEKPKPQQALPEIRHQIAGSTSHNTIEKSGSSRRKISSHKKENVKKISNSTKNVPKKHGIISKDTTTTTHRISSASIKKCQASDVGTKH